MESKDEFKKIDITNPTCYYFHDIMSYRYWFQWWFIRLKIILNIKKYFQSFDTA